MFNVWIFLPFSCIRLHFSTSNSQTTTVYLCILVAQFRSNMKCNSEYNIYFYIHIKYITCVIVLIYAYAGHWCEPMLRKFSVLLFLSLLANGVLAYLCECLMFYYFISFLCYFILHNNFPFISSFRFLGFKSIPDFS